MVPVLSAVVILVFVTCIAAVFAVHLFADTDKWNFGHPARPLLRAPPARASIRTDKRSFGGCPHSQHRG